MESKDLSRKELIKMIAKLRGMLCTANLHILDEGDEETSKEIDDILEETAFDVSEEDDWTQ